MNHEGPARKTTAVGTVGGLGQLFTVYEKNWKCTDCGQDNYARRTRCYRCRSAKPEDGGGYVMDPALTAAITGEGIPWKEAIDPLSKQVYYYNEKTGETTWERPAELGPAPFATGWFGRGAAGSVAASLYDQRNSQYLRRPARQQKEFIDPKKYHLEGANEYNIWYGRYLGDHWDSNAGKEPAESRCVLETDAGYTKADVKKEEREKRNFCLHFAHGRCAKGRECQFFHRIPTMEDDAKADELFDCFGRERHSKHRDDMSGVGSFMKPSRTLYVGGLLKSKYETPQKLEEATWRHFGEWGEIENVNVIHRLSIAFVRYRLRSNAEFAKEAMTNQPLDAGEILNVRWAHDDPNPVAEEAARRADQDALYALMQARGISLEQASFQYPAQYQLPASKKVRLDDGTEITRDFPELAYPDTDNQFQGASETSQVAAADGAHSVPPPPSYRVSARGGTKAATSGTGNAVETSDIAHIPDSKKRSLDQSEAKAPHDAYSEKDEQEEDQEEDQAADNSSKQAESSTISAAGGWVAHVDPDTGATYFYNEQTGESTWDTPEGVDEAALTAAATAQQQQQMYQQQYEQIYQQQYQQQQAYAYQYQYAHGGPTATGHSGSA